MRCFGENVRDSITAFENSWDRFQSFDVLLFSYPVIKDSLRRMKFPEVAGGSIEMLQTL